MKKKFFIATKKDSQISLIKSLIIDKSAFENVIFLGLDDILKIRYLEDVSLISDENKREIFIYNTLPIWNSSSIEAIKSLGILSAYYLASYELTKYELMELKAATVDSGFEMVLPIYGYIPVMLTKNCIKKTSGACNKKSEFICIKDKKGIRFPVESLCERCENVIYNSVPLSIHKYLKKEDFDNYYLSFTVESDENIKKIIEFYSNYFLDEIMNDFPLEYTAGHFIKGVM